MEKNELKYNFVHKNIEEYDDVIFVTGKFFIGDPGYTIDDDDTWHDYIMHHRIPGVYNKNYKKINYDLSDAVYCDNFGNMYGVDCGMFGISCVDDLDDCKIEHLEKLGKIVEIKEKIKTHYIRQRVIIRNDEVNDGEYTHTLSIIIDDDTEYFINFYY